MHTEALYYDYTSAAPFNAVISEVRPAGDKTAVILDKTIFYPEGGGQSADRGSINGVPLLDVVEKDGEILHLVAAGGGPSLQGPERPAGKLVPGPAELILDARRRRDYTVLHTAQHLLSGTILRMTGKYTASMHLGDGICTIDVEAPDLSTETLIAVEDAVMDAIEADHQVITHLCPPEDVTSFPLRKKIPQTGEVIRVVEITENDFSPCCGTHCASTGQIGMLRIVGAEKYKGMTRVTFVAGRRCLLDSRLLRQNAELISRSLSVPVAETARGVAALIEKAANLERELKDREEAEASVKAAALLEKAEAQSAAQYEAAPREAAKPGSAEKPILVFESYPDLNIDAVLRIGRLAQKKTEAILALSSGKDFKFAAFCSVKSTQLAPLFKEALEKHKGKGGGGGGFFQGSFDSAEALAAFINSVSL
jgi:alanyl-tRNA synthetase